MLTKKQKNFFDILKRFVKRNGYFPSIRELKRECGLSSTNSVWKYIKTLERKGYLIKKERSWEISKKHIYSKVPLYGIVPAGFPLEVFEDMGEEVELPEWFFKGDEEKVIALRVKGFSMQDAYIRDGDIAIVKLTSTANDGDLVVAMVEDGEITLKRFKKENDYFLLIPENDNFSVIKTKNLRILGKLIGILRKYE